MSTHIYAEHLVNINALRVHVTLLTVSNQTTEVTLSPGGSEIRVKHNGIRAVIRLPVRLVGKQQTLTIPATPATSLTYRFALDGTESAALSHSGVSDNIVPWTAAGLMADTAISCSKCSALLLPRGRVTEWKDLPSEGWAEMMEFWHCHKPNEPDAASPQKGYDASSRLNLHAGVGLVAPTSLLFIPTDLQNVKSSSGNQIACEKCEVTIGHVDLSSSGYRLHKHALAISTSSEIPAKSHDVDKWQGCFLLSTIEAQGVSKLTVSQDKGCDQALSVWIFAPDMCIASTTAPSNSPTRVAKVMWKPRTFVKHTTDAQDMNRETAGTGLLELPDTEYELLATSLQNASVILPSSMRHFQDWTVSLLPRFTTDDLG